MSREKTNGLDRKTLKQKYLERVGIRARNRIAWQEAVPSIFFAAILTASLFCQANLLAKPRSPGPPFPDSYPVLYSENFDEEFYLGATNDELTVDGLGTLEKLWLGYALQRLRNVTPFVVSARLRTIGGFCGESGCCAFHCRNRS